MAMGPMGKGTLQRLEATGPNRQLHLASGEAPGCASRAFNIGALIPLKGSFKGYYKGSIKVL